MPQFLGKSTTDPLQATTISKLNTLQSLRKSTTGPTTTATMSKTEHPTISRAKKN